MSYQFFFFLKEQERENLTKQVWDCSVEPAKMSIQILWLILTFVCGLGLVQWSKVSENLLVEWNGGRSAWGPLGAGLPNLWHACPKCTRYPLMPRLFLFLLPDQRFSLYCEEYVHISIYLTAYRLYMNYRCYQITLQWNIFTQIWRGAKFWLDIYHWGAGLVVTGLISDTGQSFYNLLLKQEVAAAPFTSKFSSL